MPATPERQREIWRVARARYRAKNAETRCSRCARPKERGALCGRCSAYLHEYKKPHLRHHTAHHAMMLKRALSPGARCAASGFTRDELAQLGEELTVDRIDSSRGYVRGNCQLLARSLNRAKWWDSVVPDWAIDALRRQWRELERMQRMMAAS